MSRIRRCFELLCLFASYAEFFPDMPDPQDAYADTVGSKVFLQSLGAAGLTGPPVRRLNLHLESRFITGML
jgi:hypothetical protein